MVKLEVTVMTMTMLRPNAGAVVNGDFSHENIFTRNPPSNSGYSECGEGYCDQCDMSQGGGSDCDNCESSCDSCYTDA